MHNGVITTVCIEVKTVDGFGIKVFYGIGIEETSGFGVVEAGLQVVKTCGGIEIVAAVAECGSRRKFFSRALLLLCGCTPTAICGANRRKERGDKVILQAKFRI